MHSGVPSSNPGRGKFFLASPTNNGSIIDTICHLKLKINFPTNIKIKIESREISNQFGQITVNILECACLGRKKRTRTGEVNLSSVVFVLEFLRFTEI